MIHYKIDVDPDLSKLTAACSAAEAVLATQIMKDTRPYVPALTMSLNQRTRTIGNHILYPGPYARYLYMGKVMVDSATGKGPMKIPDVGYRFRKGAKLVATDRDLKFTKSVHPMAQSHWVEASLAANKAKWQKVGKAAVAKYGK